MTENKEAQLIDDDLRACEEQQAENTRLKNDVEHYKQLWEEEKAKAEKQRRNFERVSRLHALLKNNILGILNADSEQDEDVDIILCLEQVNNVNAEKPEHDILKCEGATCASDTGEHISPAVSSPQMCSQYQTSEDKLVVSGNISIKRINFNKGYVATHIGPQKMEEQNQDNPKICGQTDSNISDVDITPCLGQVNNVTAEKPEHDILKCEGATCASDTGKHIFPAESSPQMCSQYQNSEDKLVVSGNISIKRINFNKGYVATPIGPQKMEEQKQDNPKICGQTALNISDVDITPCLGQVNNVTAEKPEHDILKCEGATCASDTGEHISPAESSPQMCSQHQNSGDKLVVSGNYSINVNKAYAATHIGPQKMEEQKQDNPKICGQTDLNIPEDSLTKTMPLD